MQLLSTSRSRKRLSKLEVVCAGLTDLAHRTGPGEKLPTVSRLCQDLSASLSTLTLALDELQDQGVVERRHGVGIYVSQRLQKTICFICDPRFFGVAGYSPFWDLLVEHAKRRATQHREAFEFHFAHLEDGVGSNVSSSAGAGALQPTLREEITRGKVHGVLAVGLDSDVADWIASQGVPVVAYAGFGPSTVDFDSVRGIQSATRELASRGCSRIEFWRSSEPIYEGERQTPDARMFLKILKTARLPATRAQVRAPMVSNSSQARPQEQGYHLARQVFGDGSSDVRPDGIVIDNDLMAQGALLALGNMGVRDVQIATHANKGSPVLMGFDERLILIEYDPAEIIEAMFSLLECRMRGETLALPHILIDAHLRLPTHTARSTRSKYFKPVKEKS